VKRSIFKQLITVTAKQHQKILRTVIAALFAKEPSLKQMLLNEPQLLQKTRSENPQLFSKHFPIKERLQALKSHDIQKDVRLLSDKSSASDAIKPLASELQRLIVEATEDEGFQRLSAICDPQEDSHQQLIQSMLVTVTLCNSVEELQHELSQIPGMK